VAGVPLVGTGVVEFAVVVVEGLIGFVCVDWLGVDVEEGVELVDGEFEFVVPAVPELPGMVIENDVDGLLEQPDDSKLLNRLLPSTEAPSPTKNSRRVIFRSFN
jgi:hypothetical protein